MPKAAASPTRVVGSPISVQETRVTISATVNVENGTTDFVEDVTITATEEPYQILSKQRIRTVADTVDVGDWIADATSKSAAVTQDAE
jgi:hypothetical protein